MVNYYKYSKSVFTSCLFSSSKCCIRKLETLSQFLFHVLSTSSIHEFVIPHHPSPISPPNPMSLPNHQDEHMLILCSTVFGLSAQREHATPDTNPVAPHSSSWTANTSLYHLIHYRELVLFSFTYSLPLIMASKCPAPSSPFPAGPNLMRMRISLSLEKKMRDFKTFGWWWWCISGRASIQPWWVNRWKHKEKLWEDQKFSECIYTSLGEK